MIYNATYTSIRSLSIAINQRVFIADDGALGHVVYIYSNINSIGNVALTEIAVLSQDFNATPLDIIQTVSADRTIIVGSGINTISIYDGNTFECQATYVEQAITQLGSASAIISSAGSFAVSESQLSSTTDVLGIPYPPALGNNQVFDTLTGQTYFQNQVLPFNYEAYAASFAKNQTTGEISFLTSIGGALYIAPFTTSTTQIGGAISAGALPVGVALPAASLATSNQEDFMAISELPGTGVVNTLSSHNLPYSPLGSGIWNITNNDIVNSLQPPYLSGTNAVTYTSDGRQIIVDNTSKTPYITSIPSYSRVMYGHYNNGPTASPPYIQYGWAINETAVSLTRQSTLFGVQATCKNLNTLYNLLFDIDTNLWSVGVVNQSTLIQTSSIAIPEYNADPSAGVYPMTNMQYADGYLFIVCLTNVYIYNT
jgi:hypothetical protein